MKSTSLISTGSLCFVILACSTAAQAPTGSGSAGAPTTGSGGGAGTSTSQAGAATTTAGSTGSDSGAPGVGGDMNGTAGAVNPGTGGAAGSGTAGGNNGVAGAMTGTGGGATAGAAGSGTAGGGTTIDPTDFSGGLDGALLQYPCGSGNPNYDCPQPTPCTGVSAGQPNAPVIKPSGGAATTWTVKGTAGTMYDVKVHIQGIVEVSWYHGGTRAAGTASVDVASTVPGAQSYAKDLFQTGGMPLTFADQGNGFDYNQYELDVTPPGGGAPVVYFLNSVIPGENPHTSSKTQHLSFEIDEMPTIKVPGGATISLTTRDSNCVQIQNCGTSNNGMCGQGSRSITFANATPKPPTSWTGKVTSGAGGVLNGQFVHFDVISVAVAQ